MKTRRFKFFLVLAGTLALSILVALGFSQALTSAQDKPEAGKIMGPTRTLHVPAAQSRPWGEMKSTTATLPAPVAPVAVPFRPTVSPEEYQRLKNQAGAARAAKPLAPLAVPAPPKADKSFPGATSVDHFRPSDCNIAVSNSYVVQTTNIRFDVFNRKGINSRNVLLKSFFDTADNLVDARVVYDPVWRRFIVSAVSFPTGTTTQNFHLAVSKTGNPLGAWWLNVINVGFQKTTFDFPMVGYNQDAVIISGNTFDNGTGEFAGTWVFAVAKALLYNGRPFPLPIFMNLPGTLAVPIVLDQNPIAFLACAQSEDNKIITLGLENAAYPSLQRLIYNTIPVPAYTVPPPAGQPGTSNQLDTLDSRFVWPSVQVGGSLWNVHTIANGSFATPRFYELLPSSGPDPGSVEQSGFFSASGTSFDFNASIAANSSGTALVTWTSTDPTNSVNAQVRFSGRKATDPPGSMNAPGRFLSGGVSPTFYSLFRWGDYSSVQLDPVNNNRAWIVNQTILDNTNWGTQIGRIGY